MKEGWSYKKLGEVCETLNGLWKGKKPPFVNVGVIRNANFTKDFTLRFDNIEYLDVEERQYSKRKLQKGDLIVEKSGGSEKQPVGRAVLFDKENGEFSFSNFTSVLRIRDKNTFLCEFLYKYLLFIYKRGDTSAMQKATTGIHNIEFEKYLNIDIPCIPLSEQHSIVSRLDTAFSHIDALKANAEKQLNEARKLFQAELTECMKPKEGWEEKRIGDVFQTYAGGTPLKSGKGYYESGTIPWIRSGEVCQMYIRDCEMCITEEGLKNSSAKYYPVDTILVAMYGATAAQVGILKFEATSNQAVCGILPHKDFIPEYIYYWFTNIQKDLAAQAQGGAQPNLSQVKIKKVSISYPSRTIQQAIVSHLDSLSSTIRKLEELQQKTLAECDALKQAMLKEIFE